MRRITLYGWYILGFLAVVTLCCLLCSCRTQYVTVPEYHTEYISKTDTFIKRDSIMKHDSVYVSIKGDTVTVEKWSVLYRDRWREKAFHDTIIKTDSIRVPYPVEKKLTRWQQLKVDLGEYVMVLLAMLMALYLLRKKKDIIMRI